MRHRHIAQGHTRPLTRSTSATPQWRLLDRPPRRQLATGPLEDATRLRRLALGLCGLLLCLGPMLGMASGGKESEAAGGTFPAYIPLQPPLVVNLASDKRKSYLRVDMEMMVNTQEDADALNANLPMVRDRMISLLGGRKADELLVPEARETLRGEVKEALNTRLREATARQPIADVFFTGFIVQ